MGYVVQRKAASFISQLYFRHGLQTLWHQCQTVSRHQHWCQSVQTHRHQRITNINRRQCYSYSGVSITKMS